MPYHTVPVDTHLLLGDTGCTLLIRVINSFSSFALTVKQEGENPLLRGIGLIGTDSWCENITVNRTFPFFALLTP